MSKKMIYITLVLILLAVGLFLFKNNQNKNVNPSEDLENESVSTIEIGKKAPNFTLESLNGEKISLDDLKGKKVLINFWATWCPYCVQEMPDLNKLYVENKDKDLVVLAVDIGETKETVESYLKDKNYEFTVLLDKNGEVANQYMIRGIPTSYLIDKEGKIKSIQMNMMTYEQMNELIK